MCITIKVSNFVFVPDFRALESSESQVCGLSSDGTIVEVLRKGLQGEIILDRTCFYAEGGGQEADSGQLISEVNCTQSIINLVGKTCFKTGKRFFTGKYG